ncbi:Y-family DNA polymerase [Mucilaginibacter calamicampi]|uniref:Y-family DNA polymerase n=1 Tax=Mucilaginibacter calamicampi TaxID=1302352 RepID=A0ABW2YSM9_9SPHI
MQKRYMSIWFRHLLTDWQSLRQPEMKDTPFVFAAPIRNRIIVTAANKAAENEGVYAGMAAADAKAIAPCLQVLDHLTGKQEKLLRKLALWCIRYTPLVAIDAPDGLLLDITGCTHLWDDERGYLKEIVLKLRGNGYDTRAAIADTMAAAWAVARFGRVTPIIAPQTQTAAIAKLPPAALRLEETVLEQLQKLGFRNIGSFMNLPGRELRKRFGDELLTRLTQALGLKPEFFTPVIPPVPYVERLPSLEPIKTVTGIEIAIKQLLEQICARLLSEGKGLRKAMLKCYRIDGKQVQVAISTTRGSHSVSHLQKLFGLQIDKIEPALGIELFIMEVSRVEDMAVKQENVWISQPDLKDNALAELLDKIGGKLGAHRIHRYLPAEHYWPERSVKEAQTLQDVPSTYWRTDRPRPLRLLSEPEQINEVMSLLPDYPPKYFKYKGKHHNIAKADGPERIEREWWLEQGEHRDYYALEDTEGRRYWVFRSGHYDSGNKKWFIHGFFA